MVNNQLKYICTVETHLGRVPDIPMNVGKVSQVVTNLLINAGQAIEATGKNGKVIITTCTLNGFVELRVDLVVMCGAPQSGRLHIATQSQQIIPMLNFFCIF